MTDPSGIAAAVKILLPVAQAISKPVGALAKGGYSNLQQLLYNAVHKYRENYSKRHGELKVLGMPRPASLDEIYVKVRLLDRNSIRMFESIDRIEEAFRTAKRRSFEQAGCETKPGYEVANGEQYLMVLGGPGAGKSTFLRKMGMEALQFKQERGFHHECIPVFVELKRFKELPIDIETHIEKEFATCGFPEPQKFTEGALKAGKLLVLLDGLDEVPTANRSEAVMQIQDFVDRYSKNRFIASCRIAAYNQNFRRFTDISVAEFDDEQIQDFIDNWFGKESNRANDCWEEVSKNEAVGVKELAQTPLLLTLVCLLFEKGGELPARRATLYERALRVLLEEWNASKALERDKPYKGLDTRAKESLLATIAYDFFEQDQLFFPRRELARTIETVLKEEILPEERRIDGDMVLKAIEVQHGILAERDTGIYSFSHLTLQEFLTAVQISDNPSKYLDKVVSEHLLDVQWREVFLLLVQTRQSDDITLSIERQARIHLHSSKLLTKIVKWSNESTVELQSPQKNAAHRAIALFMICDLLSAIYSLSSFELDEEGRECSSQSGGLDYSLTLSLDIARKLAPNLANRLVGYEDFHPAEYDLGISLSRFIFLSGLPLDSSSELPDFMFLRSIYSKVEVFQEYIFKNSHLLENSQAPEILAVENTQNSQLVKRDAINKIAISSIKFWLVKLGVVKEDFNLEYNDEKEISNYLYVNNLLLDCRKSTLRLSREIRDGMINRLLTP